MTADSNAFPLRPRPATSRDVARLAGVSQAAVSVVLRNKESNIGVSEPVRQRILDAASTLNYRPNRSARFMRLQRSNMVGFISSHRRHLTGQITNSLVHPFITGLNQQLAKHDFHVVLMELDELEISDRNALPKALTERFFDGLVVHVGLSQAALDLLRASGLPVIFFDSGVFEPERCLYRDERRVGRAAAELLINAGHERIAFFHLGRHWYYLNQADQVWDHHSYRFRVDGFSEAMRSRGLTPLHLVNRFGPESADRPVEDPRSIEVMARQLRDERITGVVFGGGDRVPGPLSQALMMAGLAMPRDVSLASCDVEKRLVPQEFVMGGVAFDRLAAGAMAADQIMALIARKETRSPSQVLPIETQDGHTVAPPPA